MLAIAAAPPGDAVEAARRAGDEAFAVRSEPERLKAAIASYERAQSGRPGDPALELKLARAQALWAMTSRDDSATAWTACARAAERALRRLSPAWAGEIDKGRAMAEAAPKVTGSGAEALYWLAMGTMGSAQAKGFAAVLAVKDGVRASMERSAALDERIDYGGAHRALGAWLAALPAATGGGAAPSKARFDRARALFPSFKLTLVRQAETYAVLLQDAKLFDALLADVLAFDEATAPEIAPENRLAKALAKELLGRKNRLF
jgi:hypothetical protein